jgi:hypothetical protein
MDYAERVTDLRREDMMNGYGAAMVLRRTTELDQRRRDRETQFIAPVPVSRSSYLNEKDRHYRAAETVESGGDLAERSVNRILRLDARLRKAEAEGASPRALAAIEQIQDVHGHASGLLVFDYIARPNERW